MTCKVYMYVYRLRTCYYFVYKTMPPTRNNYDYTWKMLLTHDHKPPTNSGTFNNVLVGSHPFVINLDLPKNNIEGETSIGSFMN